MLRVLGCQRLHRVNETFDHVPQQRDLAPNLGGRNLRRRRVSGASAAPATSPSIKLDPPFDHLVSGSKRRTVAIR
jgi:hypothetical protein